MTATETKRKYESLGEVVPGVLLCKFPHLKAIYVRVYRKEKRSYINRSTGKHSIEEAKAWVLENLGVLFQQEAVERGGGTNSITRKLTEHTEHQRKRCNAGSISESTFIVYEKAARHFTKWFPAHGYKRLADIKRTSLQDYALNRTNDDGIALNTANLEVVFLRMWWTWLQETEVIARPITVDKLKPAIEKRTSGEPFAPGDLKSIYNAVNSWVDEDKKDQSIGNGLTTRSVSKYNKLMFRAFLELLDEGGFRQHEISDRTWKEVIVKQTNTKRQRVINEVRVPHSAKRGFRIQIFQGNSLLQLRKLAKGFCDNWTENDYIFRNKQTNTLIDRSTFSRYWVSINQKCGLEYKLHTMRAHRITELVMSGVEPELVARNLGLSVSQLVKTYLRFVPAGNYEQLIMREKPENKELRTLIATQKDL